VAAGVVAIDGTKVEANASAWSNRTRRQIAAEILAEADATDAAEDERFGDRRGDELPARWVDRRDRPAWLREALRQLDAEGASDWETYLAERARKEAETGRKLPGRQPSKTGRHASARGGRTPPGRLRAVGSPPCARTATNAPTRSCVRSPTSSTPTAGPTAHA
jgi:hypothetical protein